MLTYILYGLFILSCVVLIVAVLLQPGKADAGALFSSSVSSAAFGPRGTQTLLAKITIGAAAAFMLIALVLALPGVTGTRSVLQSAPADTTPPPAPQPQQQPSAEATTAPAQTASPAPASGEAAPQSNSNAPASTNAAATNTNTSGSAPAETSQSPAPKP